MVDIVVSIAADIVVGIGIVVDIGAAVAGAGASLAAVHPFVDKVEPFA